jgi:CRP/FNR family transcriptional regulator, cyclic AMP receptor protein
MKKKDTAFLKKVPLFAGLSDPKISLVAGITTQRIIEAGTSIVKEGEKGSDLFILLEGEVEVSRTLLLKIAGQGLDQRDKSLMRLTADDHAFFGEMALFDESSERTASVVAKSQCVLACISRDKFFRLAESDKEIGFIVLKNIVTILISRLDKMTNDVLKLTTALSLALGR